MAQDTGFVTDTCSGLAWPSADGPELLQALSAWIMRSEAQIVLFWGPEFLAFYNATYAPTIGEKHPRAFGRPARENWSELWDDLHPLLRGVRQTGQTFTAKDRPFYLERHGYGETTYFDVSYSLVGALGADDSGVLCIVSETTDRVLAERRVSDSENRLRALVDATTDIVFHMSADWTELIQLDGKNLLSDLVSSDPNWLRSYIASEDQPALAAEVERALETETPFCLEHRVILSSGELGWFRTRAVPIRDHEGRIVEWFGAAACITDRRSQQQHLETVIHELDHRVKNSLAMVQAIARRTFSSNRDIDAAHEVFLQRLQMIANANRYLDGGRGTVELKSVVDGVMEFFAPSATRLVCGGPQVQLTQKTALAMTLALNELAKNALSYGAWSAGGGQVELSWSLDTAANLPLALVWVEKGGPAAARPRRSGYGLQLIEKGLPGEIEGEVKLRFDPGGLRCLVRAGPSAVSAE